MKPKTCHYYVDEAGDSVLFNRKKQLCVGREGCSNFFFVGVLQVDHPVALQESLRNLRAELLADPYLSSIPSMQPERRKTAQEFHAKNDSPEVRRECFRLLMKHDLKFFAVLRDKRVIARLVKEHNAKHPDYHYHPNQLYDRCISRLFKERLHKEDSYVIEFSKRGNRNRTEAMENAIEAARRNFRLSHAIDSPVPIEIRVSQPHLSAGLQAVDYFLWALQRLFERCESRYYDFVADKVSLVYDIDDTRTNSYGEYYTKENPLSLEKCKRKEPGI